MDRRHEEIPAGGVFNDMFRGNHGLWWKMLGGAAATILAVVGGYIKIDDKGKAALPDSLGARGLILAAVALVGALAGAGLVVKDVVEDRTLAGRPVAFPLRLLFGMGWGSLLLWFPLAILATFALTMLTLGF